MPPPKFPVPLAAKPKFGDHFDPWNSASTGGQVADNRLGASTGWRQSRNMKLAHQFNSGDTGGEHISDLVGAGSENWDDRAGALIPKEVRERAKCSVKDMLGKRENLGVKSAEEMVMARRTEGDGLGKKVESDQLDAQKGIFDGLVVYINGSTYPLVSDHKLKRLLAENGARLSIHLGRRSVTHVILGRPSGGVLGAGAGGGLAASKLEKEIRTVGGCGVKYVEVEWAIESLKVGKRLPETQFSNLKVAAKGQQSVYGLFKATKSSGLKVAAKGQQSVYGLFKPPKSSGV